MTPDLLLEGAGARLLEQVCADPRDDLALGSALRGGELAPELISLALAQRALRLRAGSRLRDPERLVLTRDGLEQATATSVAQHRASVFAGLGTVADVCCGIGGESRELVAGVERVIGLDRDPVHLALARHNVGAESAAGARGSFEALLGDAEALPLRAGEVDAILVDPARREGASRRRGHEETSPPLATCLAWTEVVPRVVIKSAPGLDHEAVPPGWAIEAVSIGRELKELALWSPAWERPLRRASVIRGEAADWSVESFEGTGVRGLLEEREVGRYLLDPSPSITRAGLVQELGVSLGAHLLDERIGFLTTDLSVTSPFARTLEVLETMPWTVKGVTKRLKALQIGQIDIRQRGIKLSDVEAMRSRLAGSGPGRATVVLTRMGESPIAVICS